MTQITDAKGALIAHLKTDTDLSALVGTRIFGDELPRDEADSMPRKAVVISPNGGGFPTFAQGTMPLNVQGYDVFCYGETLFQAEAVRRAAFGALRAMIRVTITSVLLHWARPAGGASSGRDPVTDWPVVWNSWQVMADERTVA